MTISNVSHLHAVKFSAHVEDRLFKKHGRLKTDRAKDDYIKETISERLSVAKNLGI
jgi:hypothetical protein